MKHLFILNPKAGRSDRTADWHERIGALMAGRSEPFRTVLTEYPEHAAAIVRRSCAGGGPWRVYVCGGDGTLSEVAHGARGLSGVSVTQVPLGHTNSFLRQFGTDHFFDLAALVDGVVRPVDLIECNDRVAMSFCAVGLDADCAPQLPVWQTRMAKPGGAYLAAQLGRMTRRLNRVYQITADGVRHTGRYLQMITFNGRHNAGGFPVLPEASPWDGALDQLLVGHPTRLRYLAALPALWGGRHAEIPDVAAWFRVQQVHISADTPFTVSHDGEHFTTGNLNICLSAHKIDFVVPSGLL